MLWHWQVPEYHYNMIGLTRKRRSMKVWLKAGVIIFYVLGYCFLRKRMRRDVVKLFKAYMLLMIFLLSLLPEPFILKHLGVTLRADTLVLWMAGIEAVDAWDEYKREKNTFLIRDTLCPELSWSHYRALMRINDEKTRTNAM